MRHKDKIHTLVAAFGVFLLIGVIGACSTEKNTFVNRTYHSTTARYNGLFNARELIRIGFENYRNVVREDFSQVLPIELMPTDEDVVEFYPMVDTAIVKCQKVIQQHSMPTASKPSQKKSEHAKWIDQNWLMIGYAQYIRKDYDKALHTFEYVRKFYEDKPSTYSGELWEVKTYIQMGDLGNARRSLQKLDAKRNLINSKDEKEKTKKTKKRKTKNVKSSSSSNKSDKRPSLPKGFEFEYFKTKAMLALAEGNEKNAIDELERALKKAKKKHDKARLSFILGQLYQRAGDAKARDYYTVSIKKDAPFEMSFNAKINRALVSNLGQDEMLKELNKLAKEQRYLEYRDQIYFAMSKIELSRPDRDMAKGYLTKSAFYSLNNDLQKGMSYEKLGDITFEDREYVSAQRYYDSSAQVIPDTYHNYIAIKNKADRLSKLVENIDIIAFEDSVQRLAKLDDKERERFLKNVIKQLKDEEKKRKELEAERAEQMRKLQQTYANQNAQTGSKFYFSNSKVMQEGVEEFKRVWGHRENEDYWRLSNKPVFGFGDDIADNDSIPADSLVDNTSSKGGIGGIPLDSLTVEDLMHDIPLTDSAMAESNKRLLESLYNSGMIYKEQLEEEEKGAEQFQRVVDHDVEDAHNVMAAFQLYKINEGSGREGGYRSYILNNYPNSDYANYLRDPDYFVKKKERDALALKDYLRSVSNFEYGLYYPVILKADQVIENEPNNSFRKEYFLLKAMAMGQVNRDKTSMIPVLEQAIEEYPGTEVAERAEDMLDMINNGLPDYEAYEAPAPDIFSYDSKKFFVIVELKEGQTNAVANHVSNYNNEYFGRLRLSTKHQVYTVDKSFVLIREFKTAPEAKAYISDFKKARRYVNDLRGNEILLISQENFQIIMQEQKLEDYRKFHEKNYE